MEFVAPDLLVAEIGNIVWKKTRFQGLTRADAEKIVAAFRDLRIELVSARELLDSAFQIAMAHQRTVYDALYVALSAREQCGYITADEKLATALRKDFPNTLWVADWSVK